MIPQDIKNHIDNYVNQKYPPGSFLYAVLTNDLMGAVSKADHINSQYLKDIMIYVYNDIPSACWGSREKVEEWLKSKVKE